MHYQLSFLLFFASVVFCQAGPWLKVEQAESVQNNDNFSKYFLPTTTFLKEMKETWAKFKQDFSRVYQSDKEESERFLIFAESFMHVKKHNVFNKSTFKMGINQFSDMTAEELKIIRGYKGRSRKSHQGGSTYLSPQVSIQLPSKVDWRTKGAVNPVKDQGQCGSCWAFSTTGSLEGQHFLKKGTLVSLSEQQLVDCSKKGNDGCNGGEEYIAFDYIKDNHGIDTENSYPYISGKTEHAGQCHFKKKTIGAQVTGYVNISSGSEKQLQEAVALKGPISVAIDASLNSFMEYESGVYEVDNCKTASDDLDHAVLVVGYGEEDGTPYWLVKNSWDTTWGEQGYIKMRRNYNNMCGIATEALYPLV